MTASPTDVVQTPDLCGAYPRLDEHQIAELSRHGERRSVSPGDILHREGEQLREFIVILQGKVAVVEGYGAKERTIAVHGTGRFLGELGLLTGQAGFVTAVVREPGEVLAVPSRRDTDDRGGRSSARRPHPAVLPDPPHPADRSGRRVPHHRLPILTRCPAVVRVRRTQQDPSPVDRPGGGRSRGRAPARAALLPARHPGGDLARRPGAA
ncbi:Crp/Fnr family transcriptional regulator [Nonomuraea ferruginea]